MTWTLYDAGGQELVSGLKTFHAVQANAAAHAWKFLSLYKALPEGWYAMAPDWGGIETDLEIFTDEDNEICVRPATSLDPGVCMSLDDFQTIMAGARGLEGLDASVLKPQYKVDKELVELCQSKFMLWLADFMIESWMEDPEQDPKDVIVGIYAAFLDRGSYYSFVTWASRNVTTELTTCAGILDDAGYDDEWFLDRMHDFQDWAYAWRAEKLQLQGYGETTAMAREGPSLPVQELMCLKPPRKMDRILDYGAGKGADVAWLQRQGYKVDAWDPEYELEAPLPEGRYDLVLMVYVLNVISSKKERRKALENAWGYTDQGGELFLVTRTRSEVDREAQAGGWKKQGDGWVTGSGSFQKGFDPEELCSLVESVTRSSCTWRYVDSRFTAVVAIKESACPAEYNGYGQIHPADQAIRDATDTAIEWLTEYYDAVQEEIEDEHGPVNPDVVCSEYMRRISARYIMDTLEDDDPMMQALFILDDLYQGLGQLSGILRQWANTICQSKAMGVPSVPTEEQPLWGPRRGEEHEDPRVPEEKPWREWWYKGLEDNPADTPGGEPIIPGVYKEYDFWPEDQGGAGLWMEGYGLTQKQEQAAQELLAMEAAEKDVEINLHDYEAVVISSSAGKDSQAMLTRMVELADRQEYPRDRLIVIHADLTELAEWDGVVELAQEQAEFYGLRFEVVSRVGQVKTSGAETFYSIGEPFGPITDYAERRGKWPGIGPTQWCTSDFKTAPIRRFITALAGDLRSGERRQVRILSCLGLRAQESKRRAKRPALSTLRDNSRIRCDEWIPIKWWSVEQVWETIHGSGVPYHFAYDLGMRRLSCCFCIGASLNDLLIAGSANQEKLREYVRVEDAIQFTFQPNRSLRQVMEELEERGWNVTGPSTALNPVEDNEDTNLVNLDTQPCDSWTGDGECAVPVTQVPKDPGGVSGYGGNMPNGDIEKRAEELAWKDTRDSYWEGPSDGSEKYNWAMTISKHRDSGLLDESNYEVISEDMRKRFGSDVEDVRFSHWAVGWVDHLFVRIMDVNGEFTPAFEAIVDWEDKLSEYPVADEEHYSNLEYETAIKNIYSEGRAYVGTGIPEHWAYDVYGWLSENNEQAIYNEDDRGAYPSDAEIEEALQALGYV